MPALAAGALAGVLAGAAPAANAATIDDLTVRKVGDRYLIALRAQLEVPAGAAYALFANLANLPAINSDVRQIRITHHPGGPVELYTEIRACVLWYCRSIHESQRMTFIRNANGGEVDATVIPEGDLRFGRAHWRFRGSGGRTELQVSAELEPAFGVPPLIGPWVVKHWLRVETEQSSVNIEKLAAAPMRAAPAASGR
jgi:hypothetical protein